MPKKEDAKDHILHYSIYWKCLEREEPYRQKAHSWFPGEGGNRRVLLGVNRMV